MSVTERVRERLLSGVRLTSAQVAEEFDCSKSILGQAVMQLRKEGVAVSAEDVRNGSFAHKVYWVEAGTRQEGIAVAAVGNGDVRSEPSRPLLERLVPMLGEKLIVSAITQHEDDRYTIALRQPSSLSVLGV